MASIKRSGVFVNWADVCWEDAWHRVQPIRGLKKESVAAFPDLRQTSDFPLLEHLAAFSEFCQTLLVVYLSTLYAAN